MSIKSDSVPTENQLVARNVHRFRRERAMTLLKAWGIDPNDPFAVTELGEDQIKSDVARLADELRAMTLTGGSRVVRMRAGDCVAFSRLTVHGSGPNQTSEPRVAYAIQYHRNDVSWIEKETGEKKLLTRFPRWKNEPVVEYSVPAGKRDGH